MKVIEHKKSSNKNSKNYLKNSINSYKDKQNEKERYLNSHKSNLEILLAIIKNYQISILTNSKNASNKYIKIRLLKLFQNLQEFKREQKADIKILEKTISAKKNSLQNQIFIDYKSDPIKNNKKLTEKKHGLYNLNSELNLLKLLNFKAENDINQINNIIIKITNDFNYLNMCMKYLSIDAKENMCIQPKYQPFITKVLHKQLDEIKEKFKLLVSAKKVQNEEIEETKKDLDQLKSNFIKKNINLMNNKDIIKEQSKEYHIENLSLNQINSHINNIIAKYNNNQEEEKNEFLSDNVIILEAKTENEEKEEESELSKVHSSQISSSSKSEKNKNIIINNNIGPTINLNIKFNLNLDKIYHFNEKMLYNSERNNKDNIHYFYNTKRQKGLSSTGSLPYFMINTIKDKTLKNSRNLNKSKLKDFNTFEKNNSNSNEILAKEYLITI